MAILWCRNILKVSKTILTIIFGGPLFFFLLLYCLLLRLKCGIKVLYFSPKKPLPSIQPQQIVFVTYAPWRGIFTRHLHISRKLSNYYNVLYCQLISISTLICHPGIVKELRHKRISPKISYLGILILPWDGRMKIISSINKFLILSIIKSKLTELHYSSFILWIWEPHRHYLIGELGERYAVYDIVDEYSELLGPSATVHNLENKILDKVDLVFTGTYALFQARKKAHTNIFFLPGGVDYELFAKVDFQKIPAEIKDINNQPIIGFYGMLDGRIDIELLQTMAVEHPEWNLLLIGPQEADFSPLKKLTNVHFLGKKEYTELPGLLHNFDVAIIPYKLNKLTQHINPNKMLELLAAGKPVVSTYLPDVEKLYADIVYIGKNKDEFVRKIEYVLKHKDKERIEKGRIFAQKNSWEVTIKKINSLIEKK
jgi:glycosyltransferase involved in cell wall biosynthesis